jgi:hypothetical protein
MVPVKAVRWIEGPSWNWTKSSAISSILAVDEVGDVASSCFWQAERSKHKHSGLSLKIGSTWRLNLVFIHGAACIESNPLV